jgi:hypothetical protein
MKGFNVCSVAQRKSGDHVVLFGERWEGRSAIFFLKSTVQVKKQGNIEISQSSLGVFKALERSLYYFCDAPSCSIRKMLKSRITRGYADWLG